MTSQVIVIDPKTDGAEVWRAELSVSGAWVQIACKDIIIRVHSEDLDAVAGDDGHG